MSDRKLAHIERVVSLEPIDGADRIEVATVLGWRCVVKKGELKSGDWVIYCEIDSIVPPTPYFEFMKERKYRVKTIKLKKQISQGLIIPLRDFSEEIGSNIEEGQDVTEILGIKKYLSPSEREADDTYCTSRKIHNPVIKFLTRFNWYRKLTKTRSKSFPEWISKTDEERIQNMPWILKKESDKQFYVTEKIDGQSATYWYKKNWFGHEFGICSRTVRKFEHDGSNWSVVAKQFGIKDKLKSLGFDVAIQGEITSPKIQGGKYHNATKRIDIVFPYDFHVFNIFDIKTKQYMNWERVKEISCKLGLKVVPIINEDFKLPPTVPEMVAYATGDSTIANIKREGIVVRSWDQSVSFKAINPEFLLGEKE